MASLVKRAVGTAAGLVLGMLIWYIGAGNGSNPYGVIASFVRNSNLIIVNDAHITVDGVLGFHVVRPSLLCRVSDGGL